MNQFESQHTERTELWRDALFRWVSGCANAEKGRSEIGRNDKGEIGGFSDAPKFFESAGTPAPIVDSKLTGLWLKFLFSVECLEAIATTSQGGGSQGANPLGKRRGKSPTQSPPKSRTSLRFYTVK